jgi:N-acetylneuraminate synthase
LALLLGAKVIEKHFTLDNKIIGMDNQMATEPEELKKMIMELNELKKIMGSYDRLLGETELKMRNKMRRSVALTKSIKAGDVITADMVTGKRPGYFISISDLSDIIGKRVNVDLNVGDYLMYDHLER